MHSKNRTRNVGISYQGSGTGASIERKTTQTTSTNNNSVNACNSSIKKKKVIQ